jgi:hypothetical protein
MATTTPNFGWPVPTSTDLVKDGATAIEALGDGVDASFVDLKGGTTGQVLAKTSGTDLDFTWVTTDDTNAIQNAIVDAKGDLIAASAADTPARLAVGNNGETLVADSATSTGLRYQSNFAAGKNKILNGAFDIWQRGSSQNLTTGNYFFLADRFQALVNFSAGTASISRQTFTPGTAPVAGYEGQYFQRVNTGTTATYVEINSKIEDVRTLAGQNVTISFWAKASSAVTVKNLIRQNFGSGGSGNVDNTANFNLTTSWTRFTRSIEPLGAMTGKTIGTSSFLQFFLYQDTGALGGLDIDLWGVQIEAGSVATAFQTATGTIQGELAACQRYYYRQTASQIYSSFSNWASAYTTAIVDNWLVNFPVTMRVAQTSGGSLTTSNISMTDGNNTFSTGTFNLSTNSQTVWGAAVRYQHGTAALTQYRTYQITANNNAAAFIEYSAEL